MWAVFTSPDLALLVRRDLKATPRLGVCVPSDLLRFLAVDGEESGSTHNDACSQAQLRYRPRLHDYCAHSRGTFQTVTTRSLSIVVH